MRISYDNGRTVQTFDLLDVERVKSLSRKAADLRLVGLEWVFHVLIPGGHVDANPVKITANKKQGTLAHVWEKYSPVNMPLPAEEVTPGTMAHDLLVGGSNSPGFCESGEGIIYFDTGDARECYFYKRPHTQDELDRATARAQRRKLATPDTPAKQAQPKKQKGVSLKDAAALCGVSVPTIRNWEAGTHTPKGWPGRDDAVLLKAFQGRRETGANMKKAVVGAVRIGDIDRLSHRAQRSRY